MPGITECMANLRHSKRLTDEHCRIVVAFVDKFTSCSLSNQQVANKGRYTNTREHVIKKVAPVGLTFLNTQVRRP